jgi:anti-sigma28 factor (negative regulator of flagellin synthesis)
MVVSKKAECVLDPLLVNGDTLPLMKDVGLSIFADACGKNRGAFVVQPPDGKTYSCLAFPDNMLGRVGITGRELSASSSSSGVTGSDSSSSSSSSSSGITGSDSSSSSSSSSSSIASPDFEVKDVEDLKNNLNDGNLTASEGVEVLNFFLKNVYQSTPDVQASPFACDINGLVTLSCDSKPATSTKTPVRAVTLAGLFTPALWATQGKELTIEEATKFYAVEDFDDMKKLGLNTVQIPVHAKLFSRLNPPVGWKDLLLDTLHQVQIAGLQVVLLLEQGTRPSADLAQLVKNAAAFAEDYNVKQSGKVIAAMVLPAMDNALLEAANAMAPSLPLWIPTKGADFTILNQYPLAAAASLDMAHTETVADVASSSSVEDRGKMFYHEATACIARAPLDYTSCYQNMMTMVSSGFDLAIDDCHLKGTSANFKDYGQCDRFDETIDSNWWKNHRYSFAARQLFAYEKGMGWSFATWKLYGSNPNKMGVLDQPAKLLALQEVVAAGIMPPLDDLDLPLRFPLDSGSAPVALACLNPPENDFEMGDATYAPTPSPPPDCGPGWWNFTTDQCDYWVPPSPAPTPGCPVCSNDTFVVMDHDMVVDCPPATNYPVNATMMTSVVESDNSMAIKAFFAGALASFVVSFIVVKLMTSKLFKRNEYEPVPAGNGQSYQDA